MKKIMIIWLLILGIGGANDDVGKYVILTDGFSTSNSKDSKLAIKVLLNDITNNNYSKKVKFGFYDKKEPVLKAYIQGNISYLSLSTKYYLEYREQLNKNTKAMYAFLTKKNEHIRYFLITKNDSSIRSIKDLKNRSLGMEKNEYMKFFYLDYQLLKNKLPSHKKYFSNIKEYVKESRLLMKVFFNKVDACVVSEETWNLMSEMNPRIAKKLKIIHKSKKIFLQNIALLSKSMDSKLFKIHQNNTYFILESVKGKQMLTLLKATQYRELDQAFLEPMLKYYQEYLALKKR